MIYYDMFKSKYMYIIIIWLPKYKIYCFSYQYISHGVIGCLDIPEIIT